MIFHFIHTEDKVLAIQGSNEGAFVSTALNISTVVSSIKPIKEGVNSFLEGSVILVKALDEVAKLYPFVGGEANPISF